MTFAVTLLFAITLAVTLVQGARSASESFTYPHAFVSADVATAARTFARVGIWHLKGVPVNNNPPVSRGDAYTHWPPLLPILLSLCYRAFGVSEKVAHIVMLFVLMVTALLVFRLGQRWLGLVGGGLAGFFWLTLPVTRQFGHLVSQQSLVTLFMVAAALAFFTNRPIVGAALIFLGALTSWEIVLVSPGLLLASRWHPELRRSATASAIGVGIGIAFVAVLYMSNSPGLAIDALQSAKFYMGLSQSYSRVLPPQVQLSFSDQVTIMLLNHVWMLGPLGLSAAIQFVTSRFHDRVLILASLGTPWLVWSLVMRSHMARHHFEFAIAAPFVALALAWMAVTASRRQSLMIGVLVVLTGVQILVLPRPVISDGYNPQALIRYAQGIREHTEPDSIVLAPLISAVPLYYSERHIVRGISTPEAVARQMSIIRREFPASPVYIALPPLFVGDFPGSRVVASNGDVVILRPYEQ